MGLATPNFIDQFDFRPNILFVEYLNHPKEIAEIFLKTVPIQIMAAIAVTGLSVFWMHILMTSIFNRTKQGIIWTAPLMSLLALILCVMAARSTLNHRPANPSTVDFSTDPLVNSLPLNSTYTTLYAIYEKIRYESGAKDPYGSMPDSEVIAIVQTSARLSKSSFSNKEIPTLHHQKNNIELIQNTKAKTASPKNLVIILEESLGAKHVGKLGGLPITPHIDALSKEGIWFNQL